jgi:hypothetical protein
LWKNCRKILRPDDSSTILSCCAAGPGPAKSFYNFSTILLQFFLVWKNLVHPDWLGEEL